MEAFIYFAAAAGAVTVFNLAICFWKGKGREHKRLVHTAVALVTVLAARFGGQCLLSRLGLGLCSLPLGILETIIGVFVLMTVWRLLPVYSARTRGWRETVGVLCGAATLLAAALFLFMGLTIYQRSERVVEYHGQQVLLMTRHEARGWPESYRHINILLHGQPVGIPLAAAFSGQG